MKRFVLILCAAGALLLAACTPKTVNIPLPEHPRPDFERADWLNLNGYWAFTFDAAAAQKKCGESKT